MTRPAATLLVCALIVLSGCSAALGIDTPGAAETASETATADGTPTPGNTATPSDSAETASATATADPNATTTAPPEDRIGVEGGVRWDDDLSVTPDDGLNESELAAVVNRTMARVEKIRQLEFEETVPVEVITRAEYRNRSVFTGEAPPRVAQFRSQIWEATFVVGENESVGDAFSELYGGAVAGYYSPSQDQIVIVSDAETPKLDRTTLAHELVHALQDQHFGYSGARTRDGRMAQQGLTEGDARYVDTLYDERCDGSWSCLPKPESGGGGSSDINRALFVSIYQPYADGSGFVHALRQRGGWDAVNAAYDDRPDSTEQTIHPEKYPEEEPESLTVEDRSTSEWSRFSVRGGSERMGELGVFTALWATGSINQNRYYDGDGPYSSRDYTSAASAGWAGDKLVPYKTDDGNSLGYVWKLRWDSVEDAKEFREKFHRLLTVELGARVVSRDAGTYRVEDGEFADGFRVQRDGKTVVITNAPTVEELSEIRSSDDR